MATLKKTATNSVTGSMASDVIVVSVGEHLDAGTITGGGGKDILRFIGTTPGDFLYLGDNISGISIVELSPATGTAQLDIDASGSVNGLTILGNNGANFITGSELDDTIRGGGNSDDLYGGAGDDTLVVSTLSGVASSTFDGEDGFDTLRVELASGTLVLGPAVFVESVVVASGGAVWVDASSIFGDSGLAISGGSGNNLLIGTALGDTINGSAGRDTLEGGAGDDLFMVIGATSVALDEAILGGDGFDEIGFIPGSNNELLALGRNVEVERVTIGAGGVMNAGVVAGAMETDVHILGNVSANTLEGGLGADTLEGGGGDDTFRISVSAQHVAGEIISGGAGFDTLVLHNVGSTQFILQAGVDVDKVMLSMPTPAVVIDGSAVASGTEYQGSDGGDAITAGGGNDTLRGQLGADTLEGGAGDDVFLYTAGTQLTLDLLDGGGGIDRLRLTAAGPVNAAFYALPSSMESVELIELGGSSVRPLHFADVGLSVSAQAMTAAVEITGTESVIYQVIGTAYGDTLSGGGGDDTLDGRDGDDSLAGGAGSDRLQGGDGNDTLDGGEDSDHYSAFGFNYEFDQIADSGTSGVDTLTLTFSSVFGLPAETVVPDFDLEGIEQVRVDVSYTSAQSFVFDFSGQDEGLGLMSFGRPSGTAAERKGLITIQGSEHDDTFSVGVHAHRYIGGGGDDTFVGASSRSRYEGGDGDDEVRLSDNFTLPASWSGIETVRLMADGDFDHVNLRAGASANALYIIGQNWNNQITGTRFDDTISGNGGSDVLSGGLGNDILEGGDEDADRLLGGAGDDVFLGYDAGDRIMGNAGEDTLRLTGSGQNLDLTAVRNTAIRGVETIDIRGEGANALKLAFGDVKDNLGTGVSHTLRIVADADDTVTLAGSWTLVDSEGITTTHSATSRGKTVFVEIEQTPAGGMTIFAVDGPDSITGGSGNDTVVFEDGTFDGSDDHADGGDGTDTLVADGTLLNMFEGTFASFEKVEVRDGANLFINNATLEVSATAGNNTVRLGNNAAQTYAGSDGVDTVHLGAAGQAVDTGAGDDLLHATAARVAGSNLAGGEGMDTLLLGGSGAVDLNELGGSPISIERIEFSTLTITSLTLTDHGFDVVLQKPTDIVSGNSEAEDDRFIFLSTNLFADGAMTIQEFHSGFDDVIQLLFTDIGAYQGEVAADGVDAALASSAGLRDVVFDTDNGRLVVDYNQDDAYGAGDLAIYLPGVSDLAAGADLILGA